MNSAQAVLVGGLALLLAFAPAAFGSVEPWASALLVTGIALLSGAWILLKGNGPDPLTRRVSGLPWLVVLLLALALVQILPLGPSLISRLSPEAAALQQSAGLGGMGVRLSLHREATLDAIGLLCAYAAAFFFTIASLRNLGAIRVISFLIVLIGFFLSVEAILQSMTAPPSTIYWVRPISNWAGHPPFGPYVNRNHFAGLMALIVPFGAGYVLSLGSRHHGTATERASLFRLICIFFVLATAAALILSKSRGGILSASAALGLMLVYLHRRGLFNRAMMVGTISAMALVALSVLWLGAGHVIEHFADLPRMLSSPGSTFRIPLWKDTLSMAGDFPLTGTGFGTFGHVFPLYQSFAVETTGFAHAHNEYLQLLAEGGIAAFLAGILALLVGYWRALTMLERRRNREVLFLGAGAVAGVTAFLLHALIDFNFRMPANAFWFSVMAALALNIIYSKT